MTFSRRALFCCLFLSLCLFACSSGRKDEKPREPVNIIYLLSDALRADHLSSYGYGVKTSPELDGLLAEGALFLNHFSQSNATSFSVASIFTGLNVPRSREHLPGKAWWPTSFKKPLPGEQWLMKLLREAGYATCGINANPYLNPKNYEIDISFDEYTGLLRPEGKDKAYFAASDIFRLVQDRLTEMGSGKFFFYIHTMEPHQPNRRTKIAEEMFHENIDNYPDPNDEKRCREIAAYDAEIRLHDEAFGDFVRFLKENRFLENTALIFSSDHGELLGENGVYGHGYTLLRPELHIPLFMIGKGIPKGKRIDALTQNVDLFPAILELTGANPPDNAVFDGKSLLPLMEEESTEIRDHGVSFGVTYQTRSVYTKRYSLIKRMEFDSAGKEPAYGKSEPRQSDNPDLYGMFDMTRLSPAGGCLPEILPSPVAERLERWMQATDSGFEPLKHLEWRLPDAPFRIARPDRIAPDDAWSRNVRLDDGLWTVRSGALLSKGPRELPPIITFSFNAPPIRFVPVLKFGKFGKVMIQSGNQRMILVKSDEREKNREVIFDEYDGRQGPYTLKVKARPDSGWVEIRRIEFFPVSEGDDLESELENRREMVEQLKSLGYLH